MEKVSIFLQRIKLQIPIRMEEAFLAFLKRMTKETRVGKETSHMADARILERRLVVSVNNTWKDLNEEQVCSLSAPNNMGVSVFSGNLAI